jgi:ATP-dependent RNA helicase DeaD
MLQDIERYTGQRIQPMRVPTPADVAARRSEMFKDSLRTVITKKEDLDLYLALVEELVEEGFDVSEVAAAAAYLARRERPLEVAVEPEARNYPSAGQGMVRLFLDAGRIGGVRPADIVGAIANEAGVPGREIGAIDISDRFSFVEVPAQYQEQVIRSMSGATLRGRPLQVRLAGEREDTPRGPGGGPGRSGPGGPRGGGRPDRDRPGPGGGRAKPSRSRWP